MAVYNAVSKPTALHEQPKYRSASRHLMITPSLACQASCAYCFGPNRGPIMRHEVFDKAAEWIDSTTPTDEIVDITFHGGEPLIPGVKWYQRNLSILRERFGDRLRLHVQSNLWLLDEAFCQLFKEYRVSLGTSLDGPEHINDPQRGAGYFRRTMEAIHRARAHGMSVGCICTFTAQSVAHIDEIFDFFLHEGLHFSIHVAESTLGAPPNELTVSSDAHSELFLRLLERYLENLDKLRISTLDALIKSVSAQRGGICTFGDCLGGHLTIGPDGGIYLCQRFAGMPDYAFGNVEHVPTMATLGTNPVWQTFKDRQDRIEEECGDCANLSHCRGGCPYKVLAANGGSFARTLRDPHCTSYKRIFSHIVDKAMDEVFAEANLQAVVEQPDAKAGMLRHGKLLAIMGDGPHPYDVTQNARRTLAVVALAATGSPPKATQAFAQLGLLTNAAQTEAAMQALWQRLTARTSGFNNIYLHVTFACPLRCEHCYSESGPGRKGTLTVDDVVHACYDAAGWGFRHVVITGGEPLVHPQRQALLDALALLRPQVKPLLTVLRTSLALRLPEEMLWRIGHSTDEVVVSVDGNRETHDRQRGAGSYDLTVGNLRALTRMGYDTDLSLATVLPQAEAHGAPGDAVRALADELGIHRVRIKPLLPLGRARTSYLEIIPDTQWGHLDPHEVMAHGFQPVATCGMGQNLYVEPDGAAYPCYACHGEKWQLGSITAEGGLSQLLGSLAFQDLRMHTVNTNRQCQRCAVRYLCGGACRAWNGPQTQPDLDAPPDDCSPLHARVRSLLESALSHLGISAER